MQSTTNSGHTLLVDQEDGVETNGLNAELLRSEIEFWKAMIESPDKHKCSRESAERMHQALALAEYRLANLDAKGLLSLRPKRLS